MSVSSMHKHKSDEEIIELVVAGEIDRFEDIINRYQMKLIAYARRITYSQQAAEDVAQETFIKSFRRLKSFKTNKKFSSWIYRIAHNEAVNYIRKHHREITVSEDGWFDTQSKEVEAVEDKMDKEFDKQFLARALSRLPLKYREPIMLYAIDGKSYQEISDILRLPIATVGTRISRAKTRLRTLLIDEERSHNG